MTDKRAGRLYGREKVNDSIIAKLAEHGLTIESTEDEMRVAFASCVAPSICLRLAQHMRKSAKA